MSWHLYNKGSIPFLVLEFIGCQKLYFFTLVIVNKSIFANDSILKLASYIFSQINLCWQISTL